MLATGLFVSYFIGDTILLSGIKSEKKIAEKTVKEVAEEETELQSIKTLVKDIKREVDEIKDVVESENKMHHADKSDKGDRATK